MHRAVLAVWLCAAALSLSPAARAQRALQGLPIQAEAQRNLQLVLQSIQDQLALQQQDQVLVQVVPVVPQQAQARLVSVDPPAQRLEQQEQQEQREQQEQQQQQQRDAERARQKPANQTAQPQFLEPGVGRWLLNGDPSCLPCICEAASGCDETLGCDDRGFCGPFLLSPRYWTLAGAPLLRGDSADRPGAAADCLRDSFCAAEAVRGYLDRFAQDCDGDRRVDCFDLARVHFQGPFNCRAPLQPPSDFSSTFRRCWDASRQGGP